MTDIFGRSLKQRQCLQFPKVNLYNFFYLALLEIKASDRLLGGSKNNFLHLPKKTNHDALVY